MLLLLSRLVMFFSGWKIEGQAPPEKKYIIVAGPHTSNWDFIFGLATKTILRLPTKYLGKSQLFRWPFGAFFRYVGGYPVDRSAHQNLVDAVVDLFNKHEEFSIAVAPEGTRSYVPELKTGFYHIARKAQIPIRMAGFDYKRKIVTIAEPFFAGPDMEADIQKVVDYFRSMTPKYPEKTIR
ncbi:MAG: lysophospholipid acyltransferase family protein [Bacteroidia bacterium]